MIDPRLELEKQHAVGALDRLTTNVAIALVATVPTLIVCVLRPWKLSELIRLDHPEGRSGMLLSPGAFFPLSMLISLMAGALLTTQEIANNNGSFLGPSLALSIQSAVEDGEVWRAVAIMLPIYGFAVLVGSLGSVLNKWTGGDWTLRTCLRAVFYVTGVLVSWVILTTAAIDLIRMTSGNSGLVNTLYSLMPIPTFGMIFWMFFWFFRNGGSLSWARSAIFSLIMILIMILSVIMLGSLAAL